VTEVIILFDWSDVVECWLNRQTFCGGNADTRRYHAFNMSLYCHDVNSHVVCRRTNVNSVTDVASDQTPLTKPGLYRINYHLIGRNSRWPEIGPPGVSGGVSRVLSSIVCMNKKLSRRTQRPLGIYTIIKTTSVCGGSSVGDRLAPHGKQIWTSADSTGGFDWGRSVVMAALCNRTGHYIFALWFLLSSFFPRLISAVADWMSAILPHMVWP